ncbi:MAG TPA: LytTR family DNA-binding domain-containing protein [Puia sp.]|jgi:DNA-binding LytR/AlgR family response regulator|nr:LytTR family DNA-binding domain-containing protein [Puia sp.]
MKVRCLLVDDEPLAIQLLQNHLEQLEDFEVVGTCTNAIKALSILNSREVDLLFLDIKMPKFSGMELLRTLKHPPRTILTTAFREFAVDCYDLDIVDYLLKPITLDRFLRSIERYLRSVDKKEPGMPAAAGKEYIYIKSNNKFFKLDLDDILYVESIKDYVKIYTTDREIQARFKISDFEKQVEKMGFLRIHRSFIVNIKHIQAFTMTHVELGRNEVPIGLSYKEHVFKALRPQD